MDYDSSIILRMDVKQFSVTDNISRPGTLKPNRPTENIEIILRTSVKLSGPLRARQNLLIVPIISIASAMLG